MRQAARAGALKNALGTLIEGLYVTEQIDRRARLRFETALRSRSLVRYLADRVYGPERETTIPGIPRIKLVLLSVRELGGRNRRFNLLVLQKADSRRQHSYRCFVGHRFTPPIEENFRWNLRELFGLYGVRADYAGYEGGASEIFREIVHKMRRSDFCLFDNRDTTDPSRPNVYIEAGMAYILRRPFIFCHYRGEAWPSDFSNINYVPYEHHRELFQKLVARLPIFLQRKVGRRARHR